MPAEPTDSPRPLGEIAQGPGAFEQFLDRNQKNITIAAVLLVVAAAGLVIFRGVKQGGEHAGGHALQTAADLASLQTVVQQHEGTAAAGSAQVLLADRQWTEGQQDEAIATLRDFLSNHPDHPARHTARGSLGAKLAAFGQPDEAREVFETLLGDPAGAFLAPYALMSLGDLARAAGDFEKAEQYYQRARAEYPSSSFDSPVSKRVQTLHAKLPAEIDPPPAPEPETTAPSPAEPPPFLAAPEGATEPDPAETDESPAETGEDAPSDPSEPAEQESPETDPSPESLTD